MDKKTKDKFYTHNEARVLLNRVDEWIKNCDSKFSILLGLLGIIVGFTSKIFETFTNLRLIIESWENTLLFDKVWCIISCILVLFYITLIILCATFSIIGINAKIKNSTKNPLFFGYIASKNEFEDFENKISYITEEDYLKYLNEQIHTNSKICKKKYKFYKKALYNLFAIIIISLVCLLFMSI